jgi:hypothetical protein
MSDDTDPGRYFVCHLCGGIFEKTCSDGESLAESRSLWGDFDPADLVSACGPCFYGRSMAELQEITGVAPRIN